LGLLALCFTLVLLYSFFVSRSIFWAFENNELLSEKVALSSRLNALESAYLTVRGSATLQKAKELGLTETRVQHFVSRPSLGKGLSLSDEL
jgi:hypothetical protein